MSEDPSAASGGGGCAFCALSAIWSDGRFPGSSRQVAVRKVHLKVSSAASASSKIQFPPSSFIPERQEVEVDPWADEAEPFVASRDP